VNSSTLCLNQNIRISIMFIGGTALLNKNAAKRKRSLCPSPLDNNILFHSSACVGHSDKIGRTSISLIWCSSLFRKAFVRAAEGRALDGITSKNRGGKFCLTHGFIFTEIWRKQKSRSFVRRICGNRKMKKSCFVCASNGNKNYFCAIFAQTNLSHKFK